MFCFSLFETEHLDLVKIKQELETEIEILKQVFKNIQYNSLSIHFCFQSNRKLEDENKNVESKLKDFMEVNSILKLEVDNGKDLIDRLLASKNCKFVVFKAQFIIIFISF